MREHVAKAFEDTFGLPILEGYGSTEMSPVVAVNRPNDDKQYGQIGHKPGTVGHAMPGVAIRIVDPDTLELRKADQEGLVLVRGANRMLGYLGQPELTAKVIENGWYRTGDLGMMDDEGFLKITDRLSRFSKIAGEMVPHGKVEETVHKVADGVSCVVTGVADDRKGERLAILYTSSTLEPNEIWKRLSETDLPKLWIPKPASIHRVEQLPLLGTGKLDLKKVRVLAEALSEE